MADLSDAPVQQRPKYIMVILGVMKEIKQVLRDFTSMNHTKRVGRGLYLLHGARRPNLEALGCISYLIFKRVNNIPRVRMIKNECDRTYAIVRYRFDSPSAKQKKSAERLRMRTPSIRLRPGVLLFPHLRLKDNKHFFSHEKGGKPVNSKKFVDQISELGGTAYRWTKLRPVTHSGQELLNNTARRTFEKRAETLETKIRALRTDARSKTLPRKTLRRRLSILFRLLRSMRLNQDLIWIFWHFDSERLYTKLYNLLLSARRAIDDMDL